MKVWLVMEHVPYEFDEVHGVYNNKEAADEHAAYLRRCHIPDDYDVHEWEVKSSFIQED